MIEAVANSSRRPGVRQTTVRMPASLSESFTAAYTSVYGPRGGARWVEEALSTFLRLRDFALRVGAGEASQTFDANKGIGLTPKCQTLLEDGIRRYRRLDPLVEGVGSQILRAAIKLRLESEDAPAPAVATDVEVKVGRLVKKAASSSK